MLVVRSGARENCVAILLTATAPGKRPASKIPMTNRTLTMPPKSLTTPWSVIIIPQRTVMMPMYTEGLCGKYFSRIQFEGTSAYYTSVSEKGFEIRMRTYHKEYN